MSLCFITTAIDYVNSTPHIGTAYEKIGADVLARFRRLCGDEVLFQMGNDEHSANVRKAALAQGLTPKVYCDQMRPQFEAVWKKLDISYGQFVQTSEPRHYAAVTKLFQIIYDKGDIYQGEYEGLYCESCEAFYTEKDLVDGHCPQHQTKPKFIKEANYFFRLSAYAERLLAHIAQNLKFILPEIRRNEIINVIKGGLKDVSVSRSGLDWGVPLPIDPKHVVYVWFDALINYLTLIGFADDGVNFKKWWPAQFHIIGKDITRFHCVIWPAMLMAADLPLPETVFGHGFVYLKGEKMSKSLGNVVSPLDIIDRFGADALRYYLMRTSSFGDDGNFTWDDFILKYNSDLANGLGNLVSRIAGMIGKYFNGELEPTDLEAADKGLADQFETRLALMKKFMDPHIAGDIQTHRALEMIWEWIGEVDQYIDQQAPWALAKAQQTGRLARVLFTVSSALFHICLLVSPFMPTTVARIWQLYGWDLVIDPDRLRFQMKLEALPKVKIAKERIPLFPRIELAQN